MEFLFFEKELLDLKKFIIIVVFSNFSLFWNYLTIIIIIIAIINFFELKFFGI